MPDMKRLLVVLVGLLVIAGCGSPKNGDNVSIEGPSVTKAETTTTSEPTTTSKPTTTVAPTTIAPAQPIEVGRWSGTSDTDTPNITVDKSWELHWKVSGGAGAAVEWTVPGEDFSTDYLSLAEGEHTSLVREGGTFYLSISTFGAAYEVWAVDVPN